MARNLNRPARPKTGAAKQPRTIKETSIRFTPTEHQGLVEGARLAGEPKAQFIREAIKERVDRLKAASSAHDWSAYIGALSGPKTDISLEQKAAFSDQIAAKHKR